MSNDKRECGLCYGPADGTLDGSYAPELQGVGYCYACRAQGRGTYSELYDRIRARRAPKAQVKYRPRCIAPHWDSLTDSCSGCCLTAEELADHGVVSLGGALAEVERQCALLTRLDLDMQLLSLLDRRVTRRDLMAERARRGSR